ncbi:hypothetical protein KAS41_01495 [Candidatus Parcubacteria bacterium]|nr:hypothetical protein [Candidatus Parcubacteria bacterium]
MNKLLTKTADMIFDRGALKFGAFKLKLHEKNPYAPLSPFYMELRGWNHPKKGPLKAEDFNLIARCLWNIAFDKFFILHAIAGIPRAGEPIVNEITRIATKPRGFRVIPLSKKETGNKRRIVPAMNFTYHAGEKALLVDDLITEADTKFEAIQALELVDQQVIGLIVLIDREQGGKEKIEQAGYPVYSAFTISQLFDYYLESGKIKQDKYQECINYLKKIK